MEPIAGGHFHRVLFDSKCGVISWSHRARFRLGLRLIGPSARRLLDYGCGDGTFLALAGGRIREGCGVDIASRLVEDCRIRFASRPNLSFHAPGEFRDGSRDGRFDVVTCMETLEHCTPPMVEDVLGDLARLVSPSGRIIISVPIETGGTFLIKSALREVAARRGMSEYDSYERYGLGDALRMIFAGRDTELRRPLRHEVYSDPDTLLHTHYGFNWLALRERVRARLAIERTLFSPLGWLGGLASSQAWFICRRG